MEQSDEVEDLYPGPFTDGYRKFTGAKFPLLPCKLCGAPAELWQRLEHGDVWSTFAACTRQVDVEGDACIFYLPQDESFYRSRKIEAALYWNELMGPRIHQSSEVMNPPVSAAKGTEAGHLTMEQRHGTGAVPRGAEARPADASPPPRHHPV